MGDLVSRLLEAIAEAEHLANAVTGSGMWTAYIEGGDDGWAIETVPDGDPDCIVGDEAMTRHMVHNDPSSVLRRCAADRKLVDLHGIVHRDIGWLEWDEGEHAEMYAELPVCGLCVPRHSSFPRREDVPEGPCRTVRILAEGYGLVVHQEGNDD